MTNSTNKSSSTLEALLDEVLKLVCSGKTADNTNNVGEACQSIIQTSTNIQASAIEDFANDNELTDASPLPLSVREHLELILASMPTSEAQQSALNNGVSNQDQLKALHTLATVLHELELNQETSNPPFPSMDALTPAVISACAPSPEKHEEEVKRAMGEKLHRYIKMRLGLR